MNSQFQEFVTRLNAERNTVREFVALLEKEQQILLNQDAEKLLALAEAKTAFANKLSLIANARRQFLSAQGAASDTGAWITKHIPSAAPIWRELRELAARADHLNHTNGEVIQLRLRSNQQALNALMGAARSTSNLYGKDGQHSIAIGGRSLGSG